jgi:hypothetical protein
MKSLPPSKNDERGSPNTRMRPAYIRFKPLSRDIVNIQV